MNHYLKRLQDTIQASTRGISLAGMNQRPAEGKWSPAEVLEHLSLTYKGTARNLERSLDAGKPLGGRPVLKQRLSQLLVLRLGYIPRGRQSPENAKPKGTLDDPLNELQGAFEKMSGVIEKCEEQFGKHAYAGDHPILGPITLGEWAKFHWVHGRHHAKQISRMRENHVNRKT